MDTDIKLGKGWMGCVKDESNVYTYKPFSVGDFEQVMEAWWIAGGQQLEADDEWIEI